MAIKVLNEICADRTFYSPPFGKHSSFHIRFFCQTNSYFQFINFSHLDMRGKKNHFGKIYHEKFVAKGRSFCVLKLN